MKHKIFATGWVTIKPVIQRALLEEDPRQYTVLATSSTQSKSSLDNKQTLKERLGGWI